MDIKILGPGCARCHQLEKTVKEVVKEMGTDASIEEVKDVRKIMAYPILTTPGLVVNGEVLCSGRVPSKAELMQFISGARDKEKGGNWERGDSEKKGVRNGSDRQGTGESGDSVL